jgi:uncharacterized membrane protein
MQRRPVLDNLPERLRASLWFTPTVMVACSIAALILLLRLDTRIDDPPALLEFSGSPETAREVASTIAGAMMGFIGVVFSITIVALQLASSQFSPRALRGFLRDRLTKVTLGAYVSTLAYALLLIRHVDGSEIVVPDLAMTGLFVLTFSSIALFIAYIDHIAHSMRVVNIIETIADEARRAVDSTWPSLEQAPSGSVPIDPFDGENGIDVRHEGAGAVLVRVDDDDLVAAARLSGGVVKLHVRPGRFVRSGCVIATVHGAPPGAGTTGIAAALSYDVERTMQDDVGYGLRQLVDIALRALSPGINDPTTAIQAIDRIHDVLGMLTTRDEPDGWVRDDDGAPRAWTPTAGWTDLVSLGLDELRIAGAGSLQVHRRMLQLLDDLIEHAPSARRAPLQTRRDALVATAETRFDQELDADLSLVADASGIG